MEQSRQQTLEQSCQQTLEHSRQQILEQYSNRQEFIMRLLADLPSEWSSLIEKFNASIRRVKQLYKIGIESYANSHHALTEITCRESISLLDEMRGTYEHMHGVLCRLQIHEPLLDDEYHPEYYTKEHIEGYMAMLNEFGISNHPDIRRHTSRLLKVDNRIGTILSICEVYVLGLSGLVKETYCDYNMAIEYYTKALERNPHNDVLRYRIGMIYMRLKNPLLALINVYQMVSEFKDGFKAMALKAVALEMIGDYEEAYQAYGICIVLAPDAKCKNAVVQTRNAMARSHGLSPS